MTMKATDIHWLTAFLRGDKIRSESEFDFFLERGLICQLGNVIGVAHDFVNK